jgi:hypothetical protein
MKLTQNLETLFVRLSLVPYVEFISETVKQIYIKIRACDILY